MVGGGFAGVEALAELQALADDALRYHPALQPADMHWTLVEATGRILPELDQRMGTWTAQALAKRGVDLRLQTRLTAATAHQITLSDGTTLPTRTLVWAAGGRPNPLAAASDLPVNDLGRIKATAYLTIDGVPDAFAAGDSAAVPDLTTPGRYCAPNAQHAIRQAKVLARNIKAHIRGRTLTPYKHTYLGSVAGLGHHQGVAQIHRLHLTGYLGWLAHRAWVPTLNHKTRVLADWTLSALFHRETIQLTALETPGTEFREATLQNAA